MKFQLKGNIMRCMNCDSELDDMDVREGECPKCGHQIETERTVDEVAGDEKWMKQDLIQFMRGQGWEDDPNGGVRHGNNHDAHYDTYFEAAKAAIEVGSMMG